MKGLIVGKGGREHAIAWKVKESDLVKKIFIAPGNIGMENIGELVNISEDKIIELADFAEKNKIIEVSLNYRANRGYTSTEIGGSNFAATSCIEREITKREKLTIHLAKKTSYTARLIPR